MKDLKKDSLNRSDLLQGEFYDTGIEVSRVWAQRGQFGGTEAFCLTHHTHASGYEEGERRGMNLLGRCGLIGVQRGSRGRIAGTLFHIIVEKFEFSYED